LNHPQPGSPKVILPPRLKQILIRSKLTTYCGFFL